MSKKRIQFYEFIIMSNYVYLIWQPLQMFTLTPIQLLFMTFTARAILAKSNENNTESLERFRINKFDGRHKIYKREPLMQDYLLSLSLFKNYITFIIIPL